MSCGLTLKGCGRKEVSKMRKKRDVINGEVSDMIRPPLFPRRNRRRTMWDKIMIWIRKKFLDLRPGEDTSAD